MMLSSLLQRAAASSLPAARVAEAGPSTGEGGSVPGGPPPQLYAEEQLCRPETLGRHAELPGVVRDLVEAGSIDARARLVRGMLHAIGFEWMGYGMVTYVRGQSWPLSFFTSYANAHWVRRYFAQRYYEVDARHQEAPASSLPLLWDVNQLEASLTGPDPSERRRRFLDDLHASGIRSGLFFRLASPTHVNEHTVISLTSSASSRSWITEGVVGQSLVLGLSVHEYLSRHARVPAAPPAARAEMSGMSPTQQYILEHLLQGRSDKEIAYRLQLSSHTVDYHMRQLRRRFAARNRVQLVKAATQSQHGESGFGGVSQLSGF
ncbi:MAG TPA: autoinducer binding domain-containing protein [Variovorax sp.]|nr:autoinducer binding domain-containing protein [Variovorax sp.]